MAGAEPPRTCAGNSDGCWCTQMEFPENYQRFLTKEQQNTACICQHCIERIAREPLIKSLKTLAY
ncbi:cysteine-rich CWC family protein [Litoribacillus peritrichatus]|uniref:cysteine-rich CWC family protein n=1 Tax=Litoribacillus peritrichatus TaxID=718191 RepID=UPI003CD070F0